MSRSSVVRSWPGLSRQLQVRPAQPRRAQLGSQRRHVEAENGSRQTAVCSATCRMRRVGGRAIQAVRSRKTHARPPDNRQMWLGGHGCSVHHRGSRVILPLVSFRPGHVDGSAGAFWPYLESSFWRTAVHGSGADLDRQTGAAVRGSGLARLDLFGDAAQRLRKADPQRAPPRQSLCGQSFHGRLTVQFGTVRFRLQADGVEADHRGHQPRRSRGSSTRESWPNLAASRSNTTRDMTIRMISIHPASLCPRYLSNADVS